METVNYDTATLIEAEYNPRQLTEAQFENLQDSIKKFGFVEPLVVNTHKDRKNVGIYFIEKKIRNRNQD